MRTDINGLTVVYKGTCEILCFVWTGWDIANHSSIKPYEGSSTIVFRSTAMSGDNGTQTGIRMAKNKDLDLYPLNYNDYFGIQKGTVYAQGRVGGLWSKDDAGELHFYGGTLKLMEYNMGVANSGFRPSNGAKIFFKTNTAFSSPAYTVSGHYINKNGSRTTDNVTLTYTYGLKIGDLHITPYNNITSSSITAGTVKYTPCG